MVHGRKIPKRYREGRKPFRKAPEVRALRTARKNMLRVMLNRGLWKLAERLTWLIDSQRPAEWKRSQFQVILDKYAAAVTAK